MSFDRHFSSKDSGGGLRECRRGGRDVDCGGEGVDRGKKTDETTKGVRRSGVSPRGRVP